MSRIALIMALIAALALLRAAPATAEELYPKHVTPQTLQSVKRGLDYLARTQNDAGYWSHSQDGQGYPVSMAAVAGMAFLANGNTPSRGPYADQVRKTMLYLLEQARPNGLICSDTEFQGRSMYAHGFSLLFLSCVYGMENNERYRERLRKAITAAIELTARAQSPMGGWYYTPGSGDEGSVTVTQLQGLRAAQNAGFTVPKGTVEAAVRYLELCKTAEGGIRYAFRSGPQTRLPISAAAIATLYNAGQYDSPLAEACLKYVGGQFQAMKHQWSKGGGHDYYCHLYAAQAFYQAGDEHWDNYFPTARDQLLKMQAGDGSWHGDVGPVYGTSTALVILQLPYRFLPIYQR